VDATCRQRAIQAVEAQVDQMNTASPLVLDRLCVFEEATPGLPFRRIADMELPV
jgi:hypothetical protein